MNDKNLQIPEAAQYIKDFEQLGFGMFVHYGLYSMLNRGEWSLHVHKLDRKEYMKMQEKFAPVPETIPELVRIAKGAGCRYICLTTRHHEGFSLYDTRGLNEYDAPHSPAGRDLIAEFVDECRKADIVPFFYHTTLDWTHHLYREDFNKYLDYLYDSVEILCTKYGKIGGLWFDGNWAKRGADWKESRLYAMIRRHQPEAMIINNTGTSKRGELGEPEIDAVTYERGMPGPLDRRGHAKYVAGEMCETLCDHWGVGDDINFKPVRQLIEEICECRKVGANMLLNVGPNGDGTVSLMQQGIMECIGRWMRTYGEAIYNGRPWLCYDNTRDFIMKDAKDANKAYLFRFNPGASSGDANVSLEINESKNSAFAGVDRKVKSIAWMDSGKNVPFRQDGDTLITRLDGYPYGQSLCVRVAVMELED